MHIKHSFLCFQGRKLADCFKEARPNELPKVSLIKGYDSKNSRYLQKIELTSLPKIIFNLGKMRLTSEYNLLRKGLVTFTTLGGFVLASSCINSSLLVSSVLGVFFCSISANSLNHYLEYPFDCQMVRTRTRVLPMCIIKPEVVVIYSLLFGLTGCSILANVNIYASLLGLSNILLYSFVYTPLKRISLYNTHVGSLVGSIPPLIGWVAAVGYIDLSAIILCGILFSWQFIHFNSLSWTLREDYCKAGYQMMVNASPAKFRRSTLFHSLLITILCIAAPFFGPHKEIFIGWATFVNVISVFLAVKFYFNPNKMTSKRLFHMSLVQITVIIGAICMCHVFNKLEDWYKKRYSNLHPIR